MFKVGDLVVYGSTGVCRILDIKPYDGVGEEGQLYYYLEPLYQNCMIYIPVETDQVSMRPIISKQEAERLMEMLPTIQVTIYNHRSVNALENMYKECIQSYNCMTLAKLTKSLYAKRQALSRENRKLGVLDERYMKKAEDLLFGELAAALEIPKEQMFDYITQRMEPLKDIE